jgi:hypothetical protein
MFSDDPEHIMETHDGDTLNLTAGYCPEYMQRSVTTVKIKQTGRSDYPGATAPRYRHYLVGKTV